MTYDQIIKHFGSVANAARELRLTVQGVYRWQTHPIPLGTQVDIEVLTKGALLADLPKSVRNRKA